MLRKFAVALVAASLIAGPALAQTGAAPAAAGQTKVDIKADTKPAVKKHVAHRHVTKKHVVRAHAAKRHVVKHHVKRTHVTHAAKKSLKTVKPAKQPAKNAG